MRLAALVVVAACTTPTTGEREAAIVGGTVDLADDAVVALAYRERPCSDPPEALCTGTLIAPRAVLTAAHCVEHASPASIVVVTGPSVDGGARVDIDAIHVHPDFDGVASDLAIVALAEPLPQAPLPVRRAAIDTSAIGASVRLVGYGLAELTGVTGVKRQGTARITEITAMTISSGPGPALTCSGDSGGPVLVSEEVAGVVAYGDPECAQSSTSMRADVQLDRFITPTLATIAASPPRTPEDPALGAACTDEVDGCGCGATGAPGSALLVVIVLLGMRSRSIIVGPGAAGSGRSLASAARRA